MNFEDSINEISDFGMASLTPMTRQRARPIMGDGGLVYDEDWSNPLVLAFEGYLYSRSSVDSAKSEPRDQGIVSDKQLIVPDPDIDIKVHDRIIINGDTWRVTGIPASDRNPHTGWRPTLVADLEQVAGGG